MISVVIITMAETLGTSVSLLVFVYFLLCSKMTFKIVLKMRRQVLRVLICWKKNWQGMHVILGSPLGILKHSDYRYCILSCVSHPIVINYTQYLFTNALSSLFVCFVTRICHCEATYIFIIVIIIATIIWNGKYAEWMKCWLFNQSNYTPL